MRGATLRAGFSVREPWTRLEHGQPAFPGDPPLSITPHHTVASAGYHVSLLTLGSGLLTLYSTLIRAAHHRMDALREASILLSDSVAVSLREESAAQRMTKIAAINEAGVNIISTLDLSRLTKLVATSASLIMEAESCVIRLLDSQTGKYGIRIRDRERHVDHLVIDEGPKLPRRHGPVPEAKSVFVRFSGQSSPRSDKPGGGGNLHQ